MDVAPTEPLFASVRGMLGTLALPPDVLLLVALAGAALAWRGWRRGGAVAVLAIAAVLLLATPMASGLLFASLEWAAPVTPAAVPGAIIILGAEASNGPDGPDVGPLTLERLRRGAALQHKTGLPMLVTAGPPGLDVPPLAATMRAVLQQDFAVPVRWEEPAARNTGDNLRLATAMLGQAGIGAAYLVTHAWHMPRAQREAARAGLPVLPAAVPRPRRPDGRLSDWVPRADYLAMSWLALREWGGLVALEAGL
ncbi:YdcF family protein [Reyranella sp.]|uniref:YdcF family protein n=1 Tax=Reyranella sp. TaxID=1929291 RepID=UPI003D1097A9